MVVLYLLSDVTCEGDTQYSFTGDKCPNVCGLPGNRCSKKNRDGCACATGKYKNGNRGRCVDVTACGCTDQSDGSYHQV